MKNEHIKKAVRERYGKIAQEQNSCCGPNIPCCCGDTANIVSKNIGYSDEELSAVPEGANLGLGCGNPILPWHHSSLAKSYWTSVPVLASIVFWRPRRWAQLAKSLAWT